MLQVVVPLLSKLPLVPAGEFRPCLFAAENDHKVQIHRYIDVCMDWLCMTGGVE